MSSDVYIDCKNSIYRQWFRIGHLATMHYYWDFLGRIRILEEKHPVITKELVVELVSLSQEYEREISQCQAEISAEYVPAEDYWKPEQIGSDLDQYMGWLWSVRVD
jgi:hypothetical protein